MADVLGQLYAWGLAFDRWRHRPVRLPRPVVSIGNVAVGGRAKTPLTAHIARGLKARGFKPVILTRGYGRRTSKPVFLDPASAQLSLDASSTGDEALELFLRCQTPVLVGKRRADNALQFLSSTADTSKVVFLLDDGFQHWALSRDFDIVVMRAEDYEQSLLPTGRLRELPEVALKRAHLVLNLGVDFVKQSIVRDTRAGLDRFCVLTTRAPDTEYRDVFLSLNPGAEFVELRDHAGLKEMHKALEQVAGRARIVFVGLKEAVKLFSNEDLKKFWLEGRGVVPGHESYLEAKLVDLELKFKNEESQLWMPLLKAISAL
jgi:tetraacyldisaccharide-1-P 4'-kinase